MFGNNLQIVLNNAVHDMRNRRHELLTIEHILYAITTVSQGRYILEGCGVDLILLNEQLRNFFSTQLEEHEIFENIEIVQTLGVQRVLNNSLIQVHDSGREFMEIGDVLVAIMAEEDTYACYYIQKQGITRLDVLTFISHSMHLFSDDNESSEKLETDGDKTKSDEKSALSKFTVDLTDKAKNGHIDALIGRTMELDRAIEVLCRRRKNNPLFVGEPGVGKTALAEGLALRIVQGAVPDIFKKVKIFSLDLGALLAGARYRGDFEGRMKSVISEIAKIPNAIMFIDEIHTIVGAGSTTNGAMDASNLLKPALASGKLRCIGSTTYEEYRNQLEKDRALSRRFQKIDISEPSEKECLDILKGLSPYYEKHHKVFYPVTVLRSAVELATRHIQERLLPDKAIDVMDEAGAALSLRRGSKDVITVRIQDIERIVARMAGIPQRSVSGQEKNRLATLQKDMLNLVYGQNEAIEMVVKSILRSRAGISLENRPAGCFLFYGPTGVGKTEVARTLAELLGINFLRFDMSEYMEKHAISRLIGAPPGYVGFDQGGLLTEAIRRVPYSLILFDEIEKAHADIFDVLLQVMDYGTLTDNTGRKSNFRNTILIMTSNAGARDMERATMGFGESINQNAASKGLKAVENTFSPEFRNRLDAIIPFKSLTPELMTLIVDKFVKELSKSLSKKKIKIELSSEAKMWFAKKGYDVSYGARPLQRLIRNQLEDVLAQEILFGKLVRGGSVHVDLDSSKVDELSFDFN